MKSILKQIIIEFHQETLPKPIKRDLNLPRLPQHVRKAFVYIGMRRSGKTWSLYQEMHTLMEQGVDQSQMLYINFEDDRLNGITVHDLQSILDVYWELYPQYIGNEKIYFFLDEIAEVEGWESFIRRLLDKETMQIYLSGSSAKMLGREIATSLRGRTITREIFPFNFKEYLQYKNFPIENTLTAKQHAHLNHHVKHYIQWGGFPETLGAEPALHRELLQGYVESVIYRDIVERHLVKNVTALRQLLLHCLQNAAALLSINKLYGQLKSRGISVSKDALYQYLHHFEDAYGLFSVGVYSLSLNKVNLKPKKIYPVDTGLITAYSIKPGYDDAARLETAVFLKLRRAIQDIHYYQTQNGLEVDFLTICPNGKMALYQVTYSMLSETTRQRELRALLQALDELQLKRGTIVTMDESEALEIDGKQISIIPASLFLKDSGVC